MLARDGQHCGSSTKALEKRAHSCDESSWGIWSTESPRWSSVTMSTTLGRAAEFVRPAEAGQAMGMTNDARPARTHNAGNLPTPPAFTVSDHTDQVRDLSFNVGLFRVVLSPRRITAVIRLERVSS